MWPWCRTAEEVRKNIECNALSAVDVTHHFLKRMVRAEAQQQQQQAGSLVASTQQQLATTACKAQQWLGVSDVCCPDSGDAIRTAAGVFGIAVGSSPPLV